MLLCSIVLTLKYEAIMLKLCQHNVPCPTSIIRTTSLQGTADYDLIVSLIQRFNWASLKTYLVFFRGVYEVPCPCDIVLDPRVVEMLHVVVVAAEIRCHSVLFQHGLQLLHQHLGGAMLGNGPHWRGCVEGEDKN